MKKGLTLLLGLLILVTFWFVIPMLLIRLNYIYNLPVFNNSLLKNIGFVIFLFGFSGTLYTVHQHLLTGMVTPVAIESPREFIDRGFYRYSRNPMYIAILTAFLGGFMILGHFLLLVYVVLAAIAMHVFTVYKEEPELKKKFGKEYEDYMKKVPRWLPTPWRKVSSAIITQ